MRRKRVIGNSIKQYKDKRIRSIFKCTIIHFHVIFELMCGATFNGYWKKNVFLNKQCIYSHVTHTHTHFWRWSCAVLHTQRQKNIFHWNLNPKQVVKYFSITRHTARLANVFFFFSSSCVSVLWCLTKITWASSINRIKVTHTHTQPFTHTDNTIIEETVIKRDRECAVWYNDTAKW